LRQINNAVFLRADESTIKKLMICNEFVAYGYPSKRMVNELVRKRGFLRKPQEGLIDKKEPITDNVLIEELFTEFNEKSEGLGCICIEDIIENINNCWKPDVAETFEEI